MVPRLISCFEKLFLAPNADVVDGYSPLGMAILPEIRVLSFFSHLLQL